MDMIVCLRRITSFCEGYLAACKDGMPIRETKKCMNKEYEVMTEDKGCLYFYRVLQPGGVDRPMVDSEHDGGPDRFTCSRKYHYVDFNCDDINVGGKKCGIGTR
jgi:hypothetical protein